MALHKHKAQQGAAPTQTVKGKKPTYKGSAIFTHQNASTDPSLNAPRSDHK